MGPTPAAQPGASAHGEAKLALYLSGIDDSLTVTCQSTWFTSDGDCRESTLALEGDSAEAYDLITETARWVWSRWKRPIQSHGPFDEQPV